MHYSDGLLLCALFQKNMHCSQYQITAPSRKCICVSCAYCIWFQFKWVHQMVFQQSFKKLAYEMCQDFFFIKWMWYFIMIHPSFLRKWLAAWWTWSRDAGGSWSERILMIRGKKCYSLHNGGNHLTVPRLELLAHRITEQKKYDVGLQHLTIINLMYIYQSNFFLSLVFW